MSHENTSRAACRSASHEPPWPSFLHIRMPATPLHRRVTKPNVVWVELFGKQSKLDVTWQVSDGTRQGKRVALHWRWQWKVRCTWVGDPVLLVNPDLHVATCATWKQHSSTGFIWSKKHNVDSSSTVVLVIELGDQARWLRWDIKYIERCIELRSSFGDQISIASYYGSDTTRTWRSAK